MAEFITAKDLPATEEEEVDVLCVNPTTGEMCRKAKTTFPRNEYDMLIRFSIGRSGTVDYARFEYGAPQDIVSKLNSGSIPKIAIAGYVFGNTISHINQLVNATDVDSDSYLIKLDTIDPNIGRYFTIELASESSKFYMNYGDGSGVESSYTIEAAS